MPTRVTEFIQQTASLSTSGWERFLEDIYGELRRLAGSVLKENAGCATIEPTSLAHEAWARLAGDRKFKSREHFLAVAAVAMRGILVDAARARMAKKRGGQLERVTLHSQINQKSAPETDLMDIHEVLRQLEEVDPRRARIVELKVFGGMTMNEIASVLGVSLTTTEADWRLARAWLGARLAIRSPDES